MDLARMTLRHPFGAHRTASDSQPSARRKSKALDRVLALTLLGAIGAYATSFTAVVDGQSMEPTLHEGQHFFASTIPLMLSPIRDGDIVVIKDWPGGYMVKRVYRTADQPVDLAHRPMNLSRQEAISDYRVPAESVLVVGDNYLGSMDSRHFGPVPLDHVVAKVVYH